jgi:hypothetical protein
MWLPTIRQRCKAATCGTHCTLQRARHPPIVTSLLLRTACASAAAPYCWSQPVMLSCCHLLLFVASKNPRPVLLGHVDTRVCTHFAATTRTHQVVFVAKQHMRVLSTHSASRSLFNLTPPLSFIHLHPPGTRVCSLLKQQLRSQIGTERELVVAGDRCSSTTRSCGTLQQPRWAVDHQAARCQISTPVVLTLAP